MSCKANIDKCEQCELTKAARARSLFASVLLPLAACVLLQTSEEKSRAQISSPPFANEYLFRALQPLDRILLPKSYNAPCTCVNTASCSVVSRTADAPHGCLLGSNITTADAP